MKKIVLSVFLLLFSLILSGQEIVEKIEIIGNNRVTDETVMFYMSSREGDYFNEDLLRRDFQTLWATGFFSDLRIEKELGNTGRLIKVIIEENPLVKNLVYETGKKIKEDEILERLREKNAVILPHSYYDPYKVQQVEKTIKEFLDEEGLPDGTVVSEKKNLGNAEIEIIFQINEGLNIKVGDIVFEGNHKLPDHVLLEAFKQNQKHNLLSWTLGKDTFKRNGIQEDLERLKTKFQEEGYMEAWIGEPRIEDFASKTFIGKKTIMKRLVIPVDAGYRYFVGEVKIEGNTKFPEKALRTIVLLNEGDIYSTKNRDDIVTELGELYADYGYLWARVVPTENLDPKRKKVNVTFTIYEGELTYLNRLEFLGNYYTKDKVIRREMILREGDRFSLAMFRDSILRMKQLGLIELDQEPDVQPDPEDPTKINVNMYVKEMQRNNIQFTAGYSGYEGYFVALSYSTVNFLGAGENLQLSIQHGKRVKNYMFGFTEPYFLDLPMNLGFTIFNRHIVYPGLYDRKGKGADFTINARIKGYLRGSLTYGFEDVDIDLPGQDEDAFVDPIYYGMFGFGTYKMSSITPTLFRNTVDSPLTPTKGTLYLASCKFAGGILGGEIDIIKPRFEWTLYLPFISNHVLGFHAQYQMIIKSGEQEVPFWERFYLGGERSIRGYNIYTIGPRSEYGTNIGGEKALVLNAEYIMPVGGPIYAILFFDAGNSYGPDDKTSLRNLFTSTGLELRIFIPALRVPFRLIFSYNNRKIYADDSNFALRFAIGTTF